MPDLGAADLIEIGTHALEGGWPGLVVFFVSLIGAGYLFRRNQKGENRKIRKENAKRSQKAQVENAEENLSASQAHQKAEDEIQAIVEDTRRSLGKDD